jgi:hypothetical protein
MLIDDADPTLAIAGIGTATGAGTSSVIRVDGAPVPPALLQVMQMMQMMLLVGRTRTADKPRADTYRGGRHANANQDPSSPIFHGAEPATPEAIGLRVPARRRGLLE